MFPQFGRWGAWSLPRARRSLRAWQKYDPPHSRRPLPWIVACAFAVSLLALGDYQSAVGVLIQKEDEANMIAVADAVKEAIAKLNRDFAHEGVSLIVTNNQAELMEDSLDTLKQAAGVGLLLGLVVLFLFLRNARFVAVLLLAIPASLLATFNLMYAWDLTLNVLSLCGLALAMGMLTDNSIVVMESIFKHFERGKTATEAARDGTAEVSKAVVAATATTAPTMPTAPTAPSAFKATSAPPAPSTSKEFFVF